MAAPVPAQVPVTPPPEQKGPFSPTAPKYAIPNATSPPTPPNRLTNPAMNNATLPLGLDAASLQDPNVDPRYLAMASRIASYYQQRCQAIANFQQQRCQAWANMHRQKCQEMMQAAMLVVAWYIRDRITRRRKKQKRVFKRVLNEKCSPRHKITKGESVRRWVMDIPLGARTPSTVHDNLADEEEATFSMDKEPAPDKDAQLFNVANNLIKSQLARIDVPLLGILNLDESESEDSEDEYLRDYDDEEEEEDDDDEEDDLYEEDLLDTPPGGEHGGADAHGRRHHDAEELGMGSEEVQLGTAGDGSRRNTTTSAS